MRPRLALLLGALVVPLLPAAPAEAVGQVICVQMPAGSSCDRTVASLSEAIAVAEAAGDAEIKLGPGTYAGGPFVIDGTGHSLSLDGSGAGTGSSSTTLVMPDTAGAQTYLSATHVDLSDLRITMSAGPGSAGDVGLDVADYSQVNNVNIVGGGGITGVIGIRSALATLRDTTVNLSAGNGNVAVSSRGGTNAFDNMWIADTAYHLDGGGDTLSRGTLKPAGAGSGALVTEGHLFIDDTLIQLGEGTGAGVLADATTNEVVMVDAVHLTVVEGGTGSTGMRAVAADPTVREGVTVTIADSIIRGQTTSLATQTTNNGSVGGNSFANYYVDHSDYPPDAVEVDNGAHGEGGVTPGPSNLDVDPAFIAPGSDYALRSGSPVVDKGSTSIYAVDRVGLPRSFDGNGDGVPVPDLGAYELNDITPPKTVITSGPSGPTNDNTPLFTFRSGPDATFECRLDGSVFPNCKSPVTTTPLPDGPHTFTVQARDAVFNVELNPPKRTFTVDTKAPGTSFTKQPPKRFFKPKVKFKFVATEPGARFQCKLDGLPWRSCRSPFRYSVKLGKHQLLVRAVDAAGNVDPTPVRYKFKRIPRPKPHHHHHHHR